ncbi:MAG TPA: vWA domain-containing protein [Polyangia bacterium]|nr:vWA domain-containing protein [Polyangia bacterium]
MNHLAYRRQGPTLALAILLSGALGCTAGVRSSGAGNGGTPGTGATTLTGSGGSTGGSTGNGTGGAHSGGDIGITGSGGNPDAAACQQKDVTFTPTNPTVYLLVDRSGSMFHCLTGATGDAVCSDPNNTSWTNLRKAIEQVLPTLESQVRFGFTTVFGANPTAGGSCPSIQGMLTDNVGPALNNASNIATKYDGLAFPPNSTQFGVKFESPASESLANVTKALMGDTSPGSKYIIFITDGQPDYCDDSNGLCAPDSVVQKLQTAYTAGIKTIVMGIQTTLFDLAPGVLQSWANAGAGEPTLPPVRANGTTFDFYDQCGQNIVPGWQADLTASGQTPMRGDTLGMYATTSGPTKPFQPSASDVNALTTALSTALSGVRSCTFDLSTFQIDADKLDEAIITLVDSSAGNMDVPLDKNSKNGWYMTDITAVTNAKGQVMHTATQVQLYGPWCDKLRSQTTTDIKFNFPCDIIIDIN